MFKLAKINIYLKTILLRNQEAFEVAVMHFLVAVAIAFKQKSLFIFDLIKVRIGYIFEYMILRLLSVNRSQK